MHIMGVRTRHKGQIITIYRNKYVFSGNNKVLNITHTQLQSVRFEHGRTTYEI
jgi:hypothetical protein